PTQPDGTPVTSIYGTPGPNARCTTGLAIIDGTPTYDPGRCSVTTLLGSAVRFTVRPPGLFPFTSPLATVPTDPTDFTITLPEIGTSVLEGVARDAAGAPVPDAFVNLRQVVGGTVLDGISTTTDGDGHYSFTVPDGFYELETVTVVDTTHG